MSQNTPETEEDKMKKRISLLEQQVASLSNRVATLSEENTNLLVTITNNQLELLEKDDKIAKLEAALAKNSSADIESSNLIGAITKKRRFDSSYDEGAPGCSTGVLGTEEMSLFDYEGGKAQSSETRTYAPTAMLPSTDFSLNLAHSDTSINQVGTMRGAPIEHFSEARFVAPTTTAQLSNLSLNLYDSVVRGARTQQGIVVRYTEPSEARFAFPPTMQPHLSNLSVNLDNSAVRGTTNQQGIVRYPADARSVAPTTMPLHFSNLSATLASALSSCDSTTTTSGQNYAFGQQYYNANAQPPMRLSTNMGNQNAVDYSLRAQQQKFFNVYDPRKIVQAYPTRKQNIKPILPSCGAEAIAATNARGVQHDYSKGWKGPLTKRKLNFEKTTCPYCYEEVDNRSFQNHLKKYHGVNN
uniref:C2H2-type domain-containing protein n=1 Tax=Meloidogyne hapla TaxID=6305 RepID=A0A1I8B161_MELHA